MMAPRFWQQKNVTACLLVPLGWLYGMAVELRFFLTRPKRVGIPVICIGNFTLGGTGKTPVAIYIAQRLKQFGLNPFFLTRGHGGSIKNPHRLIAEDTAETVGDEALLLARHAPVIVSRNRAAGAHLAVVQGAGVIVMDDGMQNPSLAKTLVLSVIDGTDGLGNGFVFPAGPLRGFYSTQRRRADAVLVVDKNDHMPMPKNSLTGRLKAVGGEWLKDTRVLAFCGIGKPDKFRRTLQDLGADIVRFEAFADHHVFDGGDAKRLIAEASRSDLTLVTTEKDHVRLQAFSETRAQLAGLANVIPVVFMPDDADAFDTLIRRAL